MIKKIMFALILLLVFFAYPGNARAGCIAQWYPVKSASAPQAIVSDTAGTVVWFGMAEASYLGHMDISGKVQYYPTAKPVSSLARDTSENIWFSYYVNGIGYIDAGKHITMKYSGGGYNLTYTLGNIWFLTGQHGYGSTSVTGPTTRYDLPQDFSANYMASGPDGNLWITDREHNTIGKVHPGSSLVTAYALPQATLPEAITTGPDGAMWFLDDEGIGRIDTRTGKITQYQISYVLLPGDIKSGPNSTLWYVSGGQGGPSDIAYLTITNGKITHLRNGGLIGRSGSAFYAHVGNREWFTDVGGDRIGYYTV